MKKRKPRNSKEKKWLNYLKLSEEKGLAWEDRLTMSDFNSQRVELRVRKLVNTPEEILARQFHESKYGHNLSTKQVNAAKRALANISMEEPELVDLGVDLSNFQNVNLNNMTNQDYDNLDATVTEIYHKLRAQGKTSTEAARWIAVHVYGSPD